VFYHFRFANNFPSLNITCFSVNISLIKTRNAAPRVPHPAFGRPVQAVMFFCSYLHSKELLNFSRFGSLQAVLPLLHPAPKIQINKI
tara:strand:+ start:1316 stop:1576 length:261 start_codon:yes stop_codon:yes gene_type:complete